VWSLGITLFELITGMHPWQVASVDDEEYALYMQHPQDLDGCWVHFTTALLQASSFLCCLTHCDDCNADIPSHLHA
jgi:serine/threonine protein kinase